MQVSAPTITGVVAALSRFADCHSEARICRMQAARLKAAHDAAPDAPHSLFYDKSVQLERQAADFDDLAMREVLHLRTLPAQFVREFSHFAHEWFSEHFALTNPHANFSLPRAEMQRVWRETFQDTSFSFALFELYAQSILPATCQLSLNQALIPVYTNVALSVSVFSA